MPSFKVNYYGTWNGDICSGESQLGLSDEELNSLRKLIKEHDGETDIDKLDLYRNLPEVYGRFETAFDDPVSLDGSMAWAVNGYLDGNFDEPENFLDKLEADGVMKFETKKEDCVDCDGEFDEDAWDDSRHEEWEEFFEALPLKQQFDILSNYLDDSIYDYECEEKTSRMYIPQEIINML